MPPAARVTDMHTCPMVTVLVPHVGGPILPPCAPTVLIDFLPAARVTDLLTCVGPPDMIAKGSAGVFINFLPAARMGDLTAHGGVIILGAPNVIIGEIGSPSPGAAGVAGIASGLALAGADKPSANKSLYGVGSPAGGRTPITQAQANAEFKKFAAQANRIPFDYPTDCCYSRAQEMCRMMKADGIDSGKVWNYANPAGPNLSVKTPNSPDGQVEWGYHVAPIVDVKGDDGVTRTQVMDPSMFDHPVSVDEWKAKQNAPNSITQYSDHFDPNSTPYYRNVDGTKAVYDPDYSQTKDRLTAHEIKRDMADPEFAKQLAAKRQQRVLDNSK